MNLASHSNPENTFPRGHIAYQIEALGNLAFEALDNCNRRCSNDDGLGESWRISAYKIAECIHVFCNAISSQIVTDDPKNDLMYRSIAFQIEAVGDSAINSLATDSVKQMGDWQVKVFTSKVLRKASKISAFQSPINSALKHSRRQGNE